MKIGLKNPGRQPVRTILLDEKTKKPSEVVIAPRQTVWTDDSLFTDVTREHLEGNGGAFGPLLRQVKAKDNAAATSPKNPKQTPAAADAPADNATSGKKG